MHSIINVEKEVLVECVILSQIAQVCSYHTLAVTDISEGAHNNEIMVDIKPRPGCTQFPVHQLLDHSSSRSYSVNNETMHVQTNAQKMTLFSRIPHLQ